MNTKYLILAASFTISYALSLNSAFAQTTTSSAAAETVATGSATVATADVSKTDDNAVKPVIKYLGYLHGTGLDFSGAHQAAINGNAQLKFEHRIKFLAAIGKHFEGGLETRTNTNFGDGSRINATAGNWRLYGSFKDLLRNDVFNLTLMPRLYLPTSTGAHNSKTTVSPDMIAELGIAPKNSRFSYDLGMEWIQLYHSQGAKGGDYANADTSIAAPWAEVDYQLTDKTQLMLSYWPTWAGQAHKGAAMTSAFAQDGGNEIDVGGYYEFAKGWQVNPFVAAELSDIGNHAPVARNLQLNVAVVGKIL